MSKVTMGLVTDTRPWGLRDRAEPDTVCPGPPFPAGDSPLTCVRLHWEGAELRARCKAGMSTWGHCHCWDLCIGDSEAGQGQRALLTNSGKVSLEI